MSKLERNAWLIMVRNYQRKTERLLMNQKTLTKAKMLISEGCSIREAATRLKVNECTLQRRLKNGAAASSLGCFEQILTPKQEKKLVEHILLLQKLFYVISLKTLRIVAFEYAESNKLPRRFNQNAKLASKDWCYSFMKRHKLSLRTAQATSIGRIMGFNQVQVKFYDNLANLKTKHNFKPSQIYNVDESGLSTVPNRLPRIIAAKESKIVSKAVSGERGQLITVVGCFNVAGDYVPPAIIFPRKRENESLIHGAPAGSLMMNSESGYINTELFVRWLRHFIANVRPSEDYPVLLILDNHTSHTCSIICF